MRTTLRRLMWVGLLASGALLGTDLSSVCAQAISWATPMPAHTTPAPTYYVTTPGYVTPAPRYVYAAPSSDIPAPTYAAPAPDYLTPAPAYSLPAPTDASTPASVASSMISDYDVYTQALFGG